MYSYIELCRMGSASAGIVQRFANDQSAAWILVDFQSNAQCTG